MRSFGDTFFSEFRQTRELEVVRELGLVLEPTMSLDEVFTVIVQKTTRLMNASRSTLFLKEADDSLVSRVIQGNGVSEIRLAPGQGIAGWTAHHGRPLLVLNAYEDSRFDPSWDRQSGFKTRSIICYPVFDQQGQAVGAIEALNKIDGPFDDGDLALLSLIAEQVSLTIENSKLMVNLVRKNRDLARSQQRLDRRNQEITLLLDLERRVAGSSNLSELFTNLLMGARDATAAEAAVLYRIDDNGAELWILGPRDIETRLERSRIGIGFPGWAATKLESVSSRLPATDPRFSEEVQHLLGFEVTAVAAVPLFGNGNGLQKGALAVYNKRNAAEFDQDDLTLLVSVGQRLAHATASFLSREEQERDRRLATVGRLMAGVLHDLKSPMTVISGYTQLLSEQMAGKAENTYLDGLSNAVDRLMSMAQEIIAFSRGERDLLIANHDITALMDRFSKEISPILDRNHVSLAIEARTGGKIPVDRDRLLRALHNIALNAVEAMGKSGGRLTIELYDDSADIVISLTDTGPGIPDEIRGSVFQSFVTFGKRRGAGLGLAVAREIVEAHGGKLTFTSVRHRGTTFFIRIPKTGK